MISNLVCLRFSPNILMIFDPDDDFGDCQNEITVVGVNFIGRGQFVVIICNTRGASRHSPKGQ